MNETTVTEWPWKVRAVPVALELAPCLLQLSAVFVFLVAARPTLLDSLGATIISLVWLSVSKSKLPDQYAEMEERKRLFTKVGEWLGQNGAGEAVERIQAEAVLHDQDGHENVQTAVTAAGIVGLIRGVATVALYAYLAALLIKWVGLQ